MSLNPMTFFRQASMRMKLGIAATIAGTSVYILSRQKISCLIKEKPWTDLHEAVFSKDFDTIRKQKNKVNEKDNYSNRMDGSLDEIFETLRLRQDLFPISPNASTKGATPLHYAVYSGDEQTIQILLELGANPELEDDLGRKPKDYAQSEKTVSFLEAEIEKQRLIEAEKKKQERKKYPLEQRLKKFIVGQNGPIQAVASAIRRRENGWNNEEKPLVLMFMGSSGIGKTELAKQVAHYLNGDLVRLDMSEYQTQHEVSKLIGSPPGYVGFDDGGQLTKKLKESPDSVVLFDEIEKAHPEILTVLLQLFDEGRLTDGKGNTVECKDAMFIMTSNLAQEEIAEKSDELRGIQSKKFIDDTVFPILRQHFRRDEFLGRIDDIIVFCPFNRPELESIVQLELEKWKKRAQERHSMEISWDKEVVEKLCEGYQHRFGARSIKHQVDKKIVNQLAEAHEKDLIRKGSKIRFYLDENQIKASFEGKKSFFSFI